MRRSDSTLLRSPYPPEVRATRLLPGIVLLVGALLAGCSSPTPGTPTPAAPPPTGPRELALEGVDPCTLLSDGDQEALELGPATSDTSATHSPLCRWARGEIRFQIGTVIGANPKDFEGYSAEHSDTEIDGYPALKMRQPGLSASQSCILTVGVKNNQVLQILVSDRFSSSYQDEAAICRDARTLAHLALTTLGRR